MDLITNAFVIWDGQVQIAALIVVVMDILNVKSKLDNVIFAKKIPAENFANFAPKVVLVMQQVKLVVKSVFVMSTKILPLLFATRSLVNVIVKIILKDFIVNNVKKVSDKNIF